MDNSRYSFYNFTETPFEGRFGGQPYVFAPGETKEFDPDKHHMLHILAKQLADRELAKGVKGILRTKEAGNDYGKAIDANGNLYKPTIEDRKALMRKSIGELADKAIPYPVQEEPEAGATKETTEDIAELKETVKSLMEMVQGLTNQLGAVKQPTVPVNSPIGNGQPPVEAVEPSSTGVTRDVLSEMLKEKGITPPENASKEQLIRLFENRGSVQTAV